jgi:Tfp pilus assembly protein PilV
MVSVFLIAVSMAGLYLGLGQGYTFTQENGQNMRATQIIGEKMETIRLYTWDQVTNGGFIPTSFTNYFYPNGDSNGRVGIAFVGTLTVTNSGLSESYADDVRKVTVSVSWHSASNLTTSAASHQLQATTLVARYGMQNYVYGTK